MNDLDKQATTNGVTPEGYAEWVADLKQRVRLTQFRAARAANTEVLHLYWSIGRDILDRQQRLGWGGKVIDRLAIDLKLEFPDQRGWSRSNLHYMRKFAEAWPGTEGFVPQAVGQLPWGHVRVLLDRLSRQSDRKWYAERAVAEGWSRNVLELCINSGLKERDSAAITNFAGTLEPPDSDLAQQITKDPYVFEHLALVSRVEERTVEQALMDRLQATLTEFGRGMAFVGRQVRLSVTDSKGATDEVVADLLLFHIPQRRYIVVELKTGRFSPGYVSQLATYVAIVDAQLRDPEYNAPTIGILLCTGKNEELVRYALGTTSTPMGVADFRGLPADAQAALPTPEELQQIVRGEMARRIAENPD